MLGLMMEPKVSEPSVKPTNPAAGPTPTRPTSRSDLLGPRGLGHHAEPPVALGQSAHRELGHQHRPRFGRSSTTVAAYRSLVWYAGPRSC